MLAERKHGRIVSPTYSLKESKYANLINQGLAFVMELANWIVSSRTTTTPEKIFFPRHMREGLALFKMPKQSLPVYLRFRKDGLLNCDGEIRPLRNRASE